MIKAGLIDEYHLFVSPAILGKGMGIFNTMKGVQKLSLVKASPLANDIVILHYQPAK